MTAHKLEVSGEIFTFNAQSEEEAELISRVITDLITKSGFVKLEAEDIHAIIDGADKLAVGEGSASGENRAKNAANEAVKNISGAKKLLLEVETGVDVSLSEMAEAAGVIDGVSDPYAVIIWGHVINEDLGDKFMVKIVAVI